MAIHRTLTRFAAWFVLAAAITATSSPAPGASGRFLSSEGAAKWVIYRPKPGLPRASRLLDVGGTGIFVLRVQLRTGLVEKVDVAQTTGWHFLDHAAAKAFKQWRFRPGVRLPAKEVVRDRKDPSTDYALVKIPVTFDPPPRSRWVFGW